MMKRSEPSKYITYDEVTTSTDPHNPLSTFLTPQVFITNYKSVSSLDDQDGVGYLMGDRRRMSSTDVFREIVKEKIAGFPHIHVDESFIGQKDGKIFEGTDTHRVLKEGDIVSPIKLESPTTSRGTTVFVSIKNIAEAIQYGLIDDSTYFEEELQGSIQALAVNVVNGTISEPMEEAEATFSNLIVSTSSDLIQWTEASQNVPIAEFNDVEIFPRSQLKSYKESHFARRSLSVLEAEKRFQTHMSEFREAINAFVSHRDRVISMIEDTNSTSRHLASSLSWSERIAKFSYDTAQGELEEFTRSEITPSLAASLGVSSTAPGLTTYTRNGKSYVSFASFKTSISTECSQFLTEIEDMYSNIDFFILNQVGVLYDLSVRLLEIITSLEQLEADLSNAINVEKKMGNVIPIIKRIPYAGPLANVFYRGFRSAILSATPVYNALKRLNNKIESIQLYSKIESIKNVSETVADNVNSARRMLTVGGRALVFVDAVCPSTRSKTSVVCQSMNDVMGPANNEMNELKAKIQTFVRDVSNGLRTVASTAEDVLTNTVFQTAKNVLASAGRMFDSLDDLLDQRIRACAWNPVCGWREKEVCETIKIRIPEVEWCSKWGVDYPCGTSYTTKSKRVCVDVSVPYGCDACLRFTIRDIVNGAAQIASFIADALESALDKAIQALGIKFDIFTIPGLPNMEVIDRVSDGLESTFSSLGFDTKMSLVKTVNVQRDAMTQSLDLSKIPQCS